MVAINAAIPTTARPTPTPIPMAAPVGKPDELPGGLPLVGSAVELLLPLLAGVSGTVEGEEAIVVDLVVEEIVDALEDVVEVSTAIFHPTTAMAPTVERLLRVVVAMDHALGDPASVDAKVSTAPEMTSDRQSPATEPGTPCAR